MTSIPTVAPTIAPVPKAALMTSARWIEVGRIVLVGIVVLLYRVGVVPLPVLFAGVAIGLYPLAKTGLLDLVHEHKIGTEVFVTIATVIAMIGHEYVAGAVLMTIILIAEFIAELNTDRARASIKALIGSVPQTALVRRGGGDLTIPVADVKVGEVVIVRAGEKIPVDGVVVGGDASVNQAPITGESVPQEKQKGATVFAGTVLESGALDVETQKVGGDTMFSRIVALVETAEESQAPVQKLADRVAAWLIPVVLMFLVGVWFVTHDLRMIITLLIFTSPAELGLATPLVVIASIARAARAGILLKGGIYLEQLAKVRVLAFDKTGTLTVGRPAVVRIERFDESVSEEALLRIAAAAERRSSHPLAKAVVERAAAAGVEVPEPAGFEVLRGRGIKANVDGAPVLAGNAALLTESGVSLPARTDTDDGTMVFIASGGRALGVLHLADPVRPDAKAALARLKASGIERIVMLTGDNEATARRIGAEVGVDEVRAGLLPDGKVEAIRQLQAGGVRIGGKSCGHCVASVRRVLQTLEGVEATNVTLGAAEVTYDRSLVSLTSSRARYPMRVTPQRSQVAAEPPIRDGCKCSRSSYHTYDQEKSRG